MVFRKDDDEEGGSDADIRQQNPLIAELERLSGELPVEIERLNHEYNKYFGGAEKKPPIQLRLQLNKKAERLQAIMRTSTNLGTTMRVQNAINKFSTYTSMWDKRLEKLESGGK